MLRRWLREIQWTVVLAGAGLMVLGTLFIYSAAYHDSGQYETRQIFWALMALLALFTIPLISYRTFLSASYLFYGVALFLLVAVFLFGDYRLGAKRWIHLGPMAIQPSEFAKLATVLALANFLGSQHRWEKENRNILIALGLALLPLLLIVRQPDLGSAIIFIPLVVVLLFLWGIRKRYLILAVVSGLAAAPLFWGLLRSYQKKRILVFLNPNLDPLGAGYTALQSRIAVGSGGLFGKGYLAGTQSQLQFVPEHHTDFIFAVIGEEWGFAGSLILLLLYGVLFRACFRVIENTTDRKAKLLAAGILTILFSQVFINIGMSFGMIPITGITLPLVSYGGSSLVTTAIALGLVLSIYRERSIF